MAHTDANHREWLPDGLDADPPGPQSESPSSPADWSTVETTAPEAQVNLTAAPRRRRARHVAALLAAAVLATAATALAASGIVDLGGKAQEPRQSVRAAGATGDEKRTVQAKRAAERKARRAAERKARRAAERKARRAAERKARRARAARARRRAQRLLRQAAAPRSPTPGRTVTAATPVAPTSTPVGIAPVRQPSTDETAQPEPSQPPPVAKRPAPPPPSDEDPVGRQPE